MGLAVRPLRVCVRRTARAEGVSRSRVLRAVCSCVAVEGEVLIAAYVTSSIVSITGAVSRAPPHDPRDDHAAPRPRSRCGPRSGRSRKVFSHPARRVRTAWEQLELRFGLKYRMRVHGDARYATGHRHAPPRPAVLQKARARQTANPSGMSLIRMSRPRAGAYQSRGSTGGAVQRAHQQSQATHAQSETYASTPQRQTSTPVGRPAPCGRLAIELPIHIPVAWVHRQLPQREREAIPARTIT